MAVVFGAARTAKQFFCISPFFLRDVTFSSANLFRSMNIFAPEFIYCINVDACRANLNVLLGKLARRFACRADVSNLLFPGRFRGRDLSCVIFARYFQAGVVPNHLRKAFVCSRSAHRILIFGIVAGFDFASEGVTDNELKRCIEEFDVLKARRPVSSCTSTNRPGEQGHPSRLHLKEFQAYLHSDGYEPVVESERLHIWRKVHNNSFNYKYKVFGTFTDISARAFFIVQCDTDYRKEWDKLVVELDVVDKDSQNDVIYWRMHYPFPMKSRDYVFIRRSFVDINRGCIVVVSHSTTHPRCPRREGIVRVDQYMSNMVISPHSTFDEDGFDYLLTYYDDPQSSFPSPIYAWMAASGVHDYLEKLHRATKSLSEECTLSERGASQGRLTSASKAGGSRSICLTRPEISASGT